MKVLVALDGSPASADTLDVVLNRRWIEGAQIRLVSVIGDSAPPVVSALFSAFGHESGRKPTANAMRSTLEQIAQQASVRHPGVLIRCDVLKGDPPEAILEFAGSYRPDLIVVGTHNKSSLDAFLLGSVSRAILDAADFPVLLARKTQRELQASGQGRVLVAVDDSECSAAAVEWLMEQTWLPGHDICLLNVSEPRPGQTFGTSIDKEATRLLKWQAEQAKVDQMLLAWADVIRRETGLSTVYTGIVEGDPVETIVKAATNWPADLIVMGSHGKSPIAKLILGSVSHKVSINAPCSVEVVKGRESRLYGDVLAQADENEELLEILEEDTSRKTSGVHILPPGMGG